MNIHTVLEVLMSKRITKNYKNIGEFKTLNDYLRHEVDCVDCKKKPLYKDDLEREAILVWHSINGFSANDYRTLKRRGYPLKVSQI